MGSPRVINRIIAKALCDFGPHHHRLKYYQDGEYKAYRAGCRSFSSAEDAIKH